MAFYVSAAPQSSTAVPRRLTAPARRHLYASIHFPEDVWQTLVRHVPYAGQADLPEATWRRLREAPEIYREGPVATPVRAVMVTARQLNDLEAWLQAAVTRVVPAKITSALRHVQAAKRVRIARPPVHVGGTDGALTTSLHREAIDAHAESVGGGTADVELVPIRSRAS